MDNARYQRCSYVQDHAKDMGIELLFLPPYSPNLNLIERLWKLTNKRCLNNKHYKDFKAFCGAIDSCLEQLAGPLKEELETLMALNFQFFKMHKSSCAPVYTRLDVPSLEELLHEKHPRKQEGLEYP